MLMLTYSVYRNISPIIKKLKQEYIAKGCSEQKAYILASKKARKIYP